MTDVRCIVFKHRWHGFHRWVGVRAPKDSGSEVGSVDAFGNTWTGGGLARPGLDPDHVVWCKRCGKDRSDPSWWMAGLGG